MSTKQSVILGTGSYLPTRIVTNFDQFNALEVNNTPPSDFEFNAILWYYTVEDSLGNKKTNLYGISFLDHPDNSTKEDEISFKRRYRWWRW